MTDTDELFVYGTLRREDGEPAEIRGFERRYDGMPWPTIAPADRGVVKGQVIEVADWARFDAIESHRPGDPERSLYWRLPTQSGEYVYVGNPQYARSVAGSSWDVDYDRTEMAAILAATEVRR